MFRELLATEGWRGAAKGFSLNVVKGPMGLSISLTVYDLMRAQFDRRNGGAGAGGERSRVRSRDQDAGGGGKRVGSEVLEEDATCKRSPSVVASGIDAISTTSQCGRNPRHDGDFAGSRASVSVSGAAEKRYAQIDGIYSSAHYMDQNDDYYDDDNDYYGDERYFRSRTPLIRSVWRTIFSGGCHFNSLESQANLAAVYMGHATLLLQA